VPDARDPPRLSWKLPAVLMSGFALFYFQHPSLLQFQPSLEKQTGQSNLARGCGVQSVPSDTQLRTLLDNPGAVEPRPGRPP
jgi:hypothetical protein